jgi:hypothetical protein
MNTAKPLQQPDLISPPRPVSITNLEASESPRRAYYIVEIIQLPPGAGFVVRKRSGCANSMGCVETWWRPGLRSALEKKALLVSAKLKKKKGRIYVDIGKLEGDQK